MTENWRCEHGKSIDEWCAECYLPEVDDIWMECDARFIRFVKVMRVSGGWVEIRRCDEDGEIPMRSVERHADLKRFHGKSGGYLLHRRLAATSGVTNGVR